MTDLLAQSTCKEDECGVRNGFRGFRGKRRWKGVAGGWGKMTDGGEDGGSCRQKYHLARG